MVERIGIILGRLESHLGHPIRLRDDGVGTQRSRDKREKSEE